MYSKKFSAFMLIGMLLLSSASQLQAGAGAFIQTWSLRTSVAFMLLTIARLTLKEKPTPKALRITRENFSAKRSIAKNSMNFWLQAFDDIVWGFGGKSADPKILGKKISMPTEDMMEEPVDGTDMLWRQYKSIPPYGFAGLSWFYIKTLSKGLEDMKGIRETVAMVGLLLTASNWVEAKNAIPTK